MTEKSVQLHFLVNPTPILIHDTEFDFTSQKKETKQDSPYIYAKLDLPEFSITDPTLVSRYLNPRNAQFFISSVDIRTNILIHDYFNLTVSPDVMRLINLGRFGIPEFFTLKASKQQRIINCLLRKTPQTLPEEGVKELIRRGIIKFYTLNHERIILSSNVCEFPIGYSLCNIISQPEQKYIMMKSEYEYYLQQNYKNDYLGSRGEVESLANKYGMIIPPHAIDYIGYYMENYEYYSRVHPDSTEMETMSDEKIFRNLGVYFMYWDRKNLLRKSDQIMYELLSNEDIMIFLPLGDYFSSNAINKTLPCSFDDPLEMISKQEAYCMGNFFSFILLSKNEIIDTLDRTDYPEFVLPQFNPQDMPGYTSIFDMNDKLISELFLLMSMYKKDERIDILSKAIIRKIQLRSKIGILYYNLKKKYDNLSSGDKNQTSEWMKTLFTLGMYFRRWSGKGNYPMSTESTKTLSGDYADNMGHEYLAKLENMFKGYSEESQEYIRGFPMFDHHNYNATIDLTKEDKSIYNFVMDTVYKKSAYCIRIASSFVIATSYIFHSKILETEIPEFYIFNMEHIS